MRWKKSSSSKKWSSKKWSSKKWSGKESSKEGGLQLVEVPAGRWRDPATGACYDATADETALAEPNGEKAADDESTRRQPEDSSK